MSLRLRRQHVSETYHSSCHLNFYSHFHWHLPSKTKSRQSQFVAQLTIVKNLSKIHEYEYVLPSSVTATATSTSNSEGKSASALIFRWKFIAPSVWQDRSDTWISLKFATCSCCCCCFCYCCWKRLVENEATNHH